MAKPSSVSAPSSGSAGERCGRTRGGRGQRRRGREWGERAREVGRGSRGVRAGEGRGAAGAAARSPSSRPGRARGHLAAEAQLDVALDGVGAADEVERVLLVAVLGEEEERAGAAGQGREASAKLQTPVLLPPRAAAEQPDEALFLSTKPIPAHPEVVEVVADAALDAVVNEATQRALAGAREAALQRACGRRGAVAKREAGARQLRGRRPSRRAARPLADERARPRQRRHPTPKNAARAPHRCRRTGG
jgi:hypothetical protein